jgi:hypothetical protein
MKRKAGRGAEVKDVSRSARVALALHRLGAGPAIAERHADLIFLAMVEYVRAQTHGFDIGEDASGFYARPRSSTEGPARELRDLRRACRQAVRGKTSLQQWTTAWAATPQRIKRRLWKPRLIKTKQKRRRDGAWIRRAGIRRDIDRNLLAPGFAAKGFVMLAPIPEIILPIIERLKHPKLQTRQRDVEALAAIAAIKANYLEITGHHRGAGTLGREVDGIFGTTLFASKSSSRLR